MSGCNNRRCCSGGSEGTCTPTTPLCGTIKGGTLTYTDHLFYLPWSGGVYDDDVSVSVTWPDSVFLCTKAVGAVAKGLFTGSPSDARGWFGLFNYGITAPSLPKSACTWMPFMDDSGYAWAFQFEASVTYYFPDVTGSPPIVINGKGWRSVTTCSPVSVVIARDTTTGISTLFYWMPVIYGMKSSSYENPDSSRIVLLGVETLDSGGPVGTFSGGSIVDFCDGTCPEPTCGGGVSPSPYIPPVIPGLPVTRRYFSQYDCTTGVWSEVVYQGRGNNAVSGWATPSADSFGWAHAFGESPGWSGNSACQRLCFVAIPTPGDADPGIVPSVPTYGGSALSGCCAPCDCPPDLPTAYILTLVAGTGSLFGTPMRWNWQQRIVTAVSACEWDTAAGDNFVGEYFDDVLGWKPTTFPAVVSLNSCQWNVLTAPAAWAKHTGQTPQGVYLTGGGVSGAGVA